MKAIKLIWLADRKHIRNYARPVVFDEYYAMPNGPVQSSVKDLAENTDFLAPQESSYRNLYIDLEGYNLLSKQEVNNEFFSDTDRTALEQVYAKFGGFDQFELVEISHKYPEWEKFKDQLSAKNARFEMDYVDFFQNPKVLDDFFNEGSEILEVAKAMFLENIEAQGKGKSV